jgi:hypothetical protein
MRLLCLLCLGTALAAQSARALPEPGRDGAFLARLMEPPTEGQTRPWHTFREPAEGASAVVEVVGELTAAELRQVKFNDFLVWFREDLRKFMLAHAGVEMAAGASTPAAGPGPRLVPLGRVGF